MTTTCPPYLPVGTLVRYRPHHPGDAWSPFVWVIVGVTIDWADWRAPTVFYRVALHEPPAMMADKGAVTGVRRDMIQEVPHAR